MTGNENPRYRRRRSIRLAGYDYSRPGYYFVTICVYDRTEHLFGKIVGAGSIGNNAGPGSKPARVFSSPQFIPNQYAEIVHNTWFDLPNHNPNIELDEFIIMPNHAHGIIRIVDKAEKRAGERRAGLEPARTEPARTTESASAKYGVALPEIVRQLKTFSARRINALRKTPGQHVWQRNYYEHIIRNETALNNIRRYIRQNPEKWYPDHENHINRECEDPESLESEYELP